MVRQPRSIAETERRQIGGIAVGTPERRQQRAFRGVLGVLDESIEMRRYAGAMGFERLTERLPVSEAEGAGEGSAGNRLCRQFLRLAVLPRLQRVLDVAQEKARLAKEIDKTGKEIGKLSKKLANQGFLAKAPEAVVEEQRERLAEEEATRARLGAALDRLQSVA